MIGSIIGDICGHPYQSWLDMGAPLINPMCRFTDDTVLTIAAADAILTDAPFRDKYLEWWKKYPDAGYDPGFNDWAEAGGIEIGTSTGNGAAMRISPIGWACRDTTSDKPLHGLVISATKPSHDSQEALDGAFVIAKMISRSINGHYAKSKTFAMYSSWKFPNTTTSLTNPITLEDMKRWDKTTSRCGVTVPQAVNCFLLSDNYEDCLCKSLYSQGDVACMAGGIAEAYFWNTTGELPISQELYKFGISKLTTEMLDVYYKFRDKYNLPNYE